MKSTILGQITDVESIDSQCIDATIYALGTVKNVNFTVSYSNLTDEQKKIVDQYRQLIIDLEPIPPKPEREPVNK